jgi:predicted permease
MRWRLVRQILAESLALAIGGSLLGLGVAYTLIRGIAAFGPEAIVGGIHIPFDLRVLLSASVAGMVSAVLSGIAPASQLWRSRTGEMLKEGERSGTASRGRLRLRSVLVVAEVALALVLSVGAGLFLRSLIQIQGIDTGFQARQVISSLVTLPSARYRECERLTAFHRAVVDRLAATPGVSSAAAAYPIPFLGSEGRGFRIVGRPVRENDPTLAASVRWVTPEFFATLGISLRRGRAFTDQDIATADRVAIIDEALPQQYWNNEDPLGQQIQQGDVIARIIGVVGHTRQSDLIAQSEKGAFYYALYQQPLATVAFLARTSGNPTALSRSMQEAVSAADPAQPIYDAKTMEERVSATLGGRRFAGALLALFALTAVLLAALGLYGVISYGVTQRTQEIGIRMALGAHRTQVLGLIIGQGMKLALVGSGIGFVIALMLARLLRSQLFGISAFDPMPFAGMVIVMAVVALVATYVPAWRAAKLNPVEACRYE